jgi:hypothetical protein
MQATGSEIKPDVAITDETINFNQSDDYTLFVLVGLDNCIYSLFDKERNIFVSLHNFPFYHVHPEEKVYQRINAVFDEGPVISESSYSSVVVSVVNNISTIVPEAILEEGKEENILLLNHSASGTGGIFSDKINSIDALNIYSLNPVLQKAIMKKFPDANLKHFSTSLIESTLIKNKHKEEKNVTMHVQASHFEVIVTQGKSLLFYNTFNYKVPEDILYYLLNVFEQLQLNPETTNVSLIGEIEKRSGIYNLLIKYIRYIEFGSRPDNINFSYGFHDIPAHYYYSLFSIVSCV